MMIPKPKTEKNLSYKQWIKTQPCLVMRSSREAFACYGPIDPHHVTPRSRGGSDKTCVPLCRCHHDEANNRNAFENKYALLLGYEIERLNREYAKQPKRETTPRQKSPVVKVSVKHCPCKQDHELSISKANVVEGTPFYQCPKLGWVKVERRTA